MERSRIRRPRPARHVPADVLVWRSDLLRQAGCEPALAWDLAADGDIDLHDLLNLIDRGCPPHLAARILAPLDRPTMLRQAASANAERARLGGPRT